MTSPGTAPTSRSGAALRIAWRALTLAGVDGVDLMRRLEQVLRAERTGEGVFATVLSLTIPAVPRAPRREPHQGDPGRSSRDVGARRRHREWLEPRPARRWACTSTTGRSMSWHCRPATGCC
ncbi:putative magnesium/manganese-dependent phosphatase domain protein [Mycobacterium kansasii]|uniref:Putative magnesium/manganese-dependent phosphatase domain protein n=1 Tax=Mycobacterium kansasii TaxID=1768 RepID=A0A1V3WAI7_MYCKA|nr:putative magnesium/manganese-dependent phosphatase domain protein [Mycobacterium kansasii]